jgi:hypothetical protein
MDSNTHPKDVRATLASLGIKLTIAGDQLKQETDPERARELRDQISALKEEARLLVERYKGERTGESGPLDPQVAQRVQAPPAAAPPAADAAPGAAPGDDVVVFADLAAPPAAPPPPSAPDVPAVDFDSVQLVYDLGGAGAAPAVEPDPLAGGALVLDEVAIAFSIDEPAAPEAAARAARGGRLGTALGLAVEESADRAAPWGRSLVAASLATAVEALARGAEEDEVIAAALYATIEERQEELQLGEIRELFGDATVALVAWSAWMARIDPWQQRDRAYVGRLQQAPPGALLVSLCGRIVETRAALARLEEVGEGAFDWGGVPRDRFFWNLRALVRAYRAAGHDLVVGPLVDAWVRAAAALDEASGGGGLDVPSGPLV